ncbi:MAG: hypothetical protein F6J97_25265, partial [Leptolyngbya sp. SIO4C1]|nr:hypothetical protein [Leptolyngbya sp. SIO4C1]
MSRSNLVFKYLIVALLLLGCFFRITQLDQKIYWGDETSTSVRIAGYTFEAIRQDFSGPYQIAAADLQQYQQLTPAKTAQDVVQGLAAEEPQLPPVYFLALRAWTQIFGSSVSATRGFSAFISLLTMPALYWLCRELFPGAGPAWLAVGLLAVSPFHVLYAQEARPQSLWTLTLLLSSAALLRARRQGTLASWSLYAGMLALSLYTYLFSALVAIAHGLYSLLSERFRWTAALRAYLFASLAGLLLFSPWMISAYESFATLDAGTGWTKLSVPLSALVRTWLLNLSRL